MVRCRATSSCGSSSSTVLGSVSNGAAGNGSFKQVGIQLDSNGAIKFDKAAFLSAYSSDPNKVQEMVTTGLSQALHRHCR